MEKTEEIYTEHDELVKLVKDGYIFNFCVAFGLNLGFRDAMKEGKGVKFMVGDYQVEFDRSNLCFTLCHQIYFARIITTYVDGTTAFIGDDENEMISEILVELEKTQPKQNGN